eukprot:scaffold226_cov167-Pinguiococcus_pyrenoidosus.AAC.9
MVDLPGGDDMLAERMSLRGDVPDDVGIERLVPVVKLGAFAEHCLVSSVMAAKYAVRTPLMTLMRRRPLKQDAERGFLRATLTPQIRSLAFLRGGRDWSQKVSSPWRSTVQQMNLVFLEGGAKWTCICLDLALLTYSLTRFTC